MNDNFYLMLPSNSSMDVFPDNTLSKFKVNLSQPIDLNPHNWEVGLAEIQFPVSWYNIRKERNFVIKDIYNTTEAEANSLFVLKRDMADPRLEFNRESQASLTYRTMLKIPAGYYSTVEDIVKYLNICEKHSVRPITFEYNSITKKAAVNLKDFEVNSIISFLLFMVQSMY